MGETDSFDFFEWRDCMRLNSMKNGFWSVFDKKW